MGPAQCTLASWPPTRRRHSLIPSLIAWAKSQPPGNVAIVSRKKTFFSFLCLDRALTLTIVVENELNTEGRRPRHLAVSGLLKRGIRHGTI